MGTPFQSIDYNSQVKPFTASGAISKYGPVYLSVANTVAAATSPAHRPIIGVALETVATGLPVSVAMVGAIVPCKVDGAVALGIRVVPSTTAGKVTGMPDGVTGSPGAVVGVALEAATANNDLIGVLVDPGYPGDVGPLRGFVSDGAITAGRLVKVGGADGKVGQAGAALTEGLVGIALNTTADGETCMVALAGAVAPATSGAAVSRNNLLTSDASGKAIASAPGAGTNSSVVGTAMYAAGAGDLTIYVAVHPCSKQG